MLYYLGIVILQMSDRQFWRTTPRTLKALCDVHIELNSPDDQKGASRGKQQGYIDQVIF